MPILSATAAQPRPSEITPQSVYSRRRLLTAGAAAGFAWSAHAGAAAPAPADAATALVGERSRIAGAVTLEKPTDWQDATGYNNFYEFGTDKADPRRNAATLKTRPWTVVVDGLVQRPMRVDIDDLLRLAPMEERIYRLRCVEGWSMVIPWVGYSLARLLDHVQPLGSARYVEFTTLADKAQMPYVGSRMLDWPYTEGLRLDEARHPLALLTFGMYGQVLPRQNGAPLRLVVPWKYGFKSAKSLVRIRLTEQMPATTWNKAAAREYGFYANVNPDVDHPRWSQATERRIGEDGLFARKRKTLPFNGYGEQVAALYAGMDLRANY